MAVPSTARLALKLRVASLRMTIWRGRAKATHPLRCKEWATRLRSGYEPLCLLVSVEAGFAGWFELVLREPVDGSGGG
jgi:hypothetical protein